MRNKWTIFSLVLIASSLCCRAQDDVVIREYINTYESVAIAEMQRTGVPASIKLAQGIHETMAGTSDLVKKSNNHFGIKCKSNWSGESVSHDDDAKGECFRKYNDPLQSYKDHSDFLKNSPRYASLFKLDPLDYKDWAYGLKNAGYATNPRYPQVIIKLIEDYDLQEYSLIAMGKALPKDELFANVSSEQSNNTSSVKSPFIESIVVNASQDESVNKQSAITKTKSTEPIAQVTENINEQQVYPSGEFKINETKVVFVKKGTSFLALAEQYNISLAWIFDFNEMKPTEAVEEDQLIYLQRKRRTGNNEFHTVKAGETLNDIARDEAMRIESLMEYNYLDKNITPATGVQLYLRKKAPAAPNLSKQ